MNNKSLKTIRIKDLGLIITGNTPPTSKRYYYGDLYPLIKPTDMQKDGRFIGDTEEKLSEKGYELFKTKILPKNITCVVTIGTIGKLCLTKEPSFCNQAVNSIILDKNKYDALYVFYLMKTTIPQVKFLSSGTASGRENVSKSAFENIKIKVLPLPIQNKISSILSAYDDLIENNTRRIKILESMAQTLYQEWFVKFCFPGHKKVKMVESELGLIPEGWEFKALKDVCNLVMGQSPKSEFYNEEAEGLPFHQGVSNFGARFPTDKIYCTVLNRIAEAGDILFSVRAPVGRINIANKKIIIGRGLCGIRSNTGNQSFIFQQLKEKFSEEDLMGGGTIFKSVTKKDMQEIKLIIPSTDILQKFESIVNPIFRNLELLISKNNNLRKTRDLLLPKLISGQIDVENLDIDTGEIAA